MLGYLAHMTDEQRIAGFAADYLSEGEFLPVWLFGGRVGAGDIPRTVRSKSSAKMTAVKQCNRQDSGWVGFVVERRRDKLIVYRVTQLGSSGRHEGVDHCWARGYYFDSDGRQIDVQVRTDTPRLRPSALAERTLAFA